jgi:hypothetical protein
MTLQSHTLHVPLPASEADEALAAAEAVARLRDRIATIVTVILTTAAITVVSIVGVALELG